ncbi:hypothetical protein N7466_004292 [Penicillium verhagenii]|uniref:uncharacterized protein n=1 Tax=Penicillium verhagenii TaxID=1562060 RepID=UPI002545B920|nr:uncharacterized protein N7466_004292 [Penicillium verhagenii]KAJ5934745.1 hypothetical protein N7466_004292 [Penicillium verhagenii]
MKLTTFLAALSLSSFAAAAPVPVSGNAPRGLLPSPGALIEKMFPHSGVPQLVGKVDKATGICTCCAVLYRVMRHLKRNDEYKGDMKEQEEATLVADRRWRDNDQVLDLRLIPGESSSENDIEAEMKV